MIRCLVRVGAEELRPATVRMQSRLRDVSRVTLVVPGVPNDPQWAFEKLGQRYTIEIHDGARRSRWEGFLDEAYSLPNGGWRLEGVGLPGVMDVSPRWVWYRDLDGDGLARRVLGAYVGVPARVTLQASSNKSPLEVCSGESDFDFLCRVTDGLVVDTGHDLLLSTSSSENVTLTANDLPFGPPMFELNARSLKFAAISRSFDPRQSYSAVIGSLPSFGHPFAEQARLASERWAKLVPVPAEILGTNATQRHALQQDLTARAQALLASACRVQLRTNRIDVTVGSAVTWSDAVALGAAEFVAAAVDCQWSDHDYVSLVTCVPSPLAAWFGRTLTRPAGPWMTSAQVEPADRDPAHLQRVRLRLSCHPQEVIWAPVLTALAGSLAQTDYQPEAGSEVAVLFLEGDLRRPVVLGALHTASTRSSSAASDQALTLKLGKVLVQVRMADTDNATAGLDIQCGDSSLQLDANGFTLRTSRSLQLASKNLVAEGKDRISLTTSNGVLELGD